MDEENSSRVAAQANELYWQTSRPAGRLADDLGISRSKFYALIEPLRLDVACTACGATVAFGNRSDREAGRGRCVQCGSTQAVPAEYAAPPGQAAVSTTPDSSSQPGTISHLPGSPELWLSALGGLALGLIIAGLWRRR